MDPGGSMTFQRFGRTHHLRLADAGDLRHVIDLDEAHWVATSAPVDTLRGDAAFLSLVDADGCGRIRASELKQAIAWLLAHLRDTTGIAQRSTDLRIDAISLDGDEGRLIHQLAQKMLASLGAAEAGRISLDQIRRIKSRVENMAVSEAGVALPQATDDPDVRRFMADVIAITAGAPHPSGQPGVGSAQIARFVAQVKAYLDWQARGTSPDDAASSELLPLGARTGDAYGLLVKMREKVNQYFGQCEAVAFNEQLASRIPPGDADFHQADMNDPESIRALIRQAPLAPPRPDRTLDLNDSINHHYAAALDELRTGVLEPVLGAPVLQLTESQWRQVKSQFAPYEAWLSSKPSDAVAALDREKLEAYCEPAPADAARALINRSHETAFQLDKIRIVEKLALYQAHMLDLANNYVSFPALYDVDDRAMFEMGTLVMDGRRFNLAMKAANRAEHAKVARGSNMFVLYVKLSRKGSTALTEMAMPVTSGGKGNLAVGKRGIFEDVDGLQWDAQVVQMIENPIGLGEAITAPFKRIGKLVGAKIEQITGTAEKGLDQATQQAIDRVEDGSKGGAPAQQQQQVVQTRGIMAGSVLAGGGLALAAVGSALAYIGAIVTEHGFMVLLIVGGGVLAVIVPSVLLSYLKLRRRDLSAILEGAGWAINARMRLTRAQSVQFTRRPAYPPGARGVRNRRHWLITVIALICAAAVAHGAYRAWQTLQATNQSLKTPAKQMNDGDDKGPSAAQGTKDIEE